VLTDHKSVHKYINLHFPIMLRYKQSLHKSMIHV